MLDKIKKIFENAILPVTLIFFMGVIIYYNVVWDYFLIALLLCTSYILGNKFKINGTNIEKFFMKIALGLGLIGIAIYFILLLGIGNKSLYFILYALIWLVCVKDAINNFQSEEGELRWIKEHIGKYRLLGGILILGLALYTMIGSAPMSMYDTLTKHLPITVYAAENGEWYTNVTESIVYGEPMVLQYTYSTLFAVFGAYKALVLFNVVLLFLVFGVLAYLTYKIYCKTNWWILGVILLTTPFFFVFATVFYLEILPLFFFFSAFVGCARLDAKKIWDNIEVISLICGFSLFVKLTHLFTLAVIAMVLAVICIIYAVKKKKVFTGIRKAVGCLCLGMAPSIVSIFHIWYKTGNPFFPNFNELFKSPYFAQYNFADPFTNKLSFSLKSLIDIVFYPEKNIEMGRYAFGIYLLFIFTIPVAVFLLRKQREGKYLFIWSGISVAAYLANTLTTYNLRYYSAVWVLFIVSITVSISTCINIVKQKYVMRGISVCILVVLLLPNVWYIRNIYQFTYKIQKNEAIVKNAYCDLFDLIPEGKRVLSVTNSNQFKGQYKGYFASTTWHNTTTDKVLDGTYTWKQYISSFDYVLIDKLCEKLHDNEEIMDVLTPMLGKKVSESEGCSLYEIDTVQERKIILEKNLESSTECNVMNPLVECIENNESAYYITHCVNNKNLQPVTMRYQINWMKEDGAFLGTTIMTYLAAPGRGTYCSDAISTNKKADYGMVYICTADEQTVEVESFKVEVVNDIIAQEIEQFDKRIRLKNR